MLDVADVGLFDNDAEGLLLGLSLGCSVISCVGLLEGCVLGATEGYKVGLMVGL